MDREAVWPALFVVVELHLFVHVKVCANFRSAVKSARKPPDAWISVEKPSVRVSDPPCPSVVVLSYAAEKVCVTGGSPAGAGESARFPFAVRQTRAPALKLFTAGTLTTSAGSANGSALSI